MILLIRIRKIVNIKKIKNKNLLKTAFFIYCLFLITVLFLCRIHKSGARNLNLIPFYTINRYFLAYKNNNINNFLFYINIIGNLLLFVPMGIFIPLLFKNKIKNFFQFFLLSFLIIVLIEIIQFITCTGTADIDDVILNQSGAFISYIITQLCKKAKKCIDKNELQM